MGLYDNPSPIRDFHRDNHRNPSKGSKGNGGNNKGAPKGNGGKGNGGKGNGGNKAHKSPFYKSAKRAVRNELKPQFAEIKRFINQLRTQGTQAVNAETTTGNRTQSDLQSIFGTAQNFNTSQQQHIAQVMGQAQQGLSRTYGTTAQNIDNAYNRANETTDATLNRLGITPVTGRLAEDQAWMQGLNEQNRGNAASALTAQQNIFAQGGGMLGQAIAGEGATQQGAAAVATAESIRRLREAYQNQVGDLQTQRSDLRRQRGSMIQDATQLLKQQAFEQMMEQAQLSALNQQKAADLKFNYAQLSETAQYHNAQNQQASDRLAFDISKEQHDRWMDAHSKGSGSRQKFDPNSDLSGWGDAKQYALYSLKGAPRGVIEKLQPLLHSMQSGWNGALFSDNAENVHQPAVIRKAMYDKSIAYLTANGLMDNAVDRQKYSTLINNLISIGQGDF